MKLNEKSSIIYNLTQVIPAKLNESLKIQDSFRVNKSGVCYTFLGYCADTNKTLNDPELTLYGIIQYINDNGYLNAEHIPLFYVFIYINSNRFS